MRKAGIVACSNPMKEAFRDQLSPLLKMIETMGLTPVISPCLFQDPIRFSATGQERARELMKMYETPGMEMIFDLSGGDMANEVLPYLDYDQIASSTISFWGYSDLTTIDNAIYSRTGRETILYQIRNLLYDDGIRQQEEMSHYIKGISSELFDFEYSFLQGSYLEGILVGGNIRCLLKLAGTEYFPDVRDKILFLEARSGQIPQMITFFSQLKMLGVFEKIRGLVLGTFTQMEREQAYPGIVEIARSYLGEEKPLLKTSWIGHGTDSKALRIGGRYRFQKEKK